MWYYHLNFVLLRQTFMCYEWDDLLLEVGVVSIALASDDYERSINITNNINNLCFEQNPNLSSTFPILISNNNSMSSKLTSIFSRVKSIGKYFISTLKYSIIIALFIIHFNC